MIKNSQRQKQKRQEARWLQGLIGEDWGIRVLPRDADKLRPVHANRNQRFEAVIAEGAQRRKPVGRISDEFHDLVAASPWESTDTHRPSGIWLDRLSQRLILRHFDGVPRQFRIKGEIVTKPETMYFTGRRAKKGEPCRTLVMVDIDAHKTGDLKNAMQFAGVLKGNYFSDSYVEVSTNGNGAHIFLIIDKTGWMDAQYNAILKELDAWLKSVLAETGIVLDGVEIKGTCALVSWKDGVPTHTAGTLAKLPREWERFDALRASPTYAPHQLMALVRDNPIKAEEHAERVQEMRKAGSTGCTGIDPKRLEGWLEVGKRLLPAAVHCSTNNRLVVTSEDVGIVCALLEFIGKHMNEDGTLPWRRTKRLWDVLEQRGVVGRSFNSKRFAWIRRFLSGAGLVDVQDPTYVIGERAAKWSPSEKFWELTSSLDQGGEGGQDFTETCFVGDPQECWEKGVPLVLAGITTRQTAERRRMEELVEAIVCHKVWNLAA